MPIATTPAEVAAERKKKEPFYEVTKDPDDDDKFHWCLWSGNGRAMARSVEGYDTMKHTLQAIRLIGPNATAAKLIVKSHQEDDDQEDEAAEGDVDEEAASE